MMRDVLSGILALAAGAVAVYVVYLSLAGSAEVESGLSTTAASNGGLFAESAAPACEEHEELPCTLSDSCPGRQVCLNGEWIGCIAPVPICAPGETQSCSFKGPTGSCAAGVRVCNECGTEWSGCS